MRGRIGLKTRWFKGGKNKSDLSNLSWKSYLLKDPSIARLYQERIKQYLKNTTMNHDVENEWKDLRTLIEKVAEEVLGKKKKNVKKKGLYIWNEDLNEAIAEKKKLYLKWLANKDPQSLELYKIQCKKTKSLVKNAYKDIWDKYISNIEHDIHGRQLMAYKAMKHLNNDEKDAAKLQVLDDKEWLKYSKNLWHADEEEEEKERSDTPVLHNAVDKLESIELEALRNTKNKKTPGLDNINIELLKYLPAEAKSKLLDLFNNYWTQNIIPTEWKTALVIPIFKKGLRTICENYRGISLLNTTYKVYAKIINNKLKKIMEAISLEEQTGFRKGRSCSDNMFVLKLLIEKRREFNLQTYMFSIDYVKAFDNVLRGKLWSIMDRRGIPKHLIEVIRNMYKDTQINVRTKSGKILKEFINKGVRQGCCMSPTLFNIYLDDAIRIWKQKMKFLNFTDNFNNKKFIMTLLFADDQVMISDNEDTLQRALYELQMIIKEYNLEISIQKTKSMAFQGKYPNRCKLVVNSQNIEQVSSFKFLGCDLSYKGEIDADKKIEKFNRMCGTIRRTLKSKVRKDTIMKFYKTLAVPCGLYGCEIWTMDTKIRSRIQTAEMKFLRGCIGATRRDRIRNEEIRNYLGIYNLNGKIDEYRKAWRDHIDRMEDTRIPKQILKYKPRGKRNIGRPKRRWIDQ